MMGTAADRALKAAPPGGLRPALTALPGVTIKGDAYLVASISRSTAKEFPRFIAAQT